MICLIVALKIWKYRASKFTGAQERRSQKKITDGRKSKKNTWKQQQQLRNKNRGLRMLILFLNMA